MSIRHLHIACAALAVCVNASTQEPVGRTWKVDGIDRTALVFLPSPASGRGAGGEGRLPLVFVFHGHGGGMRQASRGFGIHRLWPEAVVVYPQGLPTPGQLTDPEGKRSGWQKTATDQGGRDLKFFDAMLATLKKELRIDEKRVYATGHSNGGSFTYLLWAERGDTFAAVAPSGSLSIPSLPKMKPKPVLHVAGEKDPLVKFDWQERFAERVRKLNGCEVTGKEWAKVGPLTATIYPSRTPFIWATYPGGHRFPPETPALIVRFFKER